MISDFIIKRMRKFIKIIFIAGMVLCGCRPSSLSQTTILGNSKSIVYDISFSRGGTLLISTEEKSVNLFNVITTQLLKSFTGTHTKDILSVAISSDSSKILSGGKDGLVVMWDIHSGKALKVIKAHDGVVTSVKFHPASELVISAGSDNKIVVYDYKEEKVKYSLLGHQDDVLALALNSDGTILASGGADKSIILWDLQTGNRLQRMTEHKSWIRALAFNGEGNKLLSAGDDSKISIWKMAESKIAEKISSVDLGSDWILGVDVAGEALKNETIVSAGMDGNIKINTFLGGYVYNIKRPVHNALLKPNNGLYITVALATRGKGVVLIDAKDMKAISSF